MDNSRSPQIRKQFAINTLAPGCRYNADINGEIIKWLTPDISQPSDADIQAKVDEFAAEWDVQEYARNRQADYPDWSSQLNKIYDDGLTKWKAEMVDPVKTKWPKDNSGPV